MKKMRVGRFLCLLAFLGVSIFLLIAADHCFLENAYPRKYTDLVETASEQSQIPQELLYAVIRTESHFDPDAVSYASAYGLMQMTADTFDWVQLKTDGKVQMKQDRLFEPEISVRYGARLLRLLTDRYHNTETALCAYHAGIGNVDSWLRNPEYSSDGSTLDRIPIEETRNYAKKVLRTMQYYQTLYSK
ncbi:MAG: lytic transglycosylase domain-containing protein [Clostridiales bacterium]|nr:lytic transglycosylase domain-containing protein [Clostridiales bacterium]